MSTITTRGLRAAVFGASGGIGRALVDALCSSGQYSEVHAGARKIVMGLPHGARAFTFDLTDERSIVSAAQAIGGSVDMVFVTTGLLHDPARGIAPEKSLRMIDADVMGRVLAINAIGPALIAKHMLPRLPRDRRAVFAALSARVGSLGDNQLGGWHAYRASKAALNMLIVNIAIELQRTHPLALAVALHPGTVATPLSEPFQRHVATGKLFTPQGSVSHVLRVIDNLGPSDSGGLFSWDGVRLPY